MSYRCNWCGAVFDTPHEQHYRNYHGPELGWERVTEDVCPECGDGDIEEFFPEDEDDDGY